jgi:hypothetical protein
VLWGKNFREA